MYLGEGKEAKEFAKQFLDQRSRWRQMQRNVQQYEEDNMCIPAKAINPGQSSDFHEVKVNTENCVKFIRASLSNMIHFLFEISLNPRSLRRRCRKWMPVCWDSAFLLRRIASTSVSAISWTACESLFKKAKKKISTTTRQETSSNLLSNQYDYCLLGFRDGQLRCRHNKFYATKHTNSSKFKTS